MSNQEFMTKRETIAMHALVGHLNSYNGPEADMINRCVKKAVKTADELLKELSKIK